MKLLGYFLNFVLKVGIISMVKINLGPASELTAGNRKIYQFEGLYIVVFNIESLFYAIDQKCTHFGGDLATGKLFGKTIKCPMHGAEYDLESGKYTNQIGKLAGALKKPKDTKIYKVSVVDGNLTIEK
jgi:3-phenylpropionate/trans-cinnamate dioxygenase ferredoxin subunit